MPAYVFGIEYAERTVIIKVHANISSGVCGLNICLQSLSTSVLSVFSSEGSGSTKPSLLDNAISSSISCVVAQRKPVSVLE